MQGMKVRDFYKRNNYEDWRRYLLGILICTFVFIPAGLTIKLIDKILGGRS